ncbi:MAG TPA: CPBP family intramembrane glutamic endopeptidase [Roseiflexaceae bacterium]
MTQYDTPYTASPGETPARPRKWPLAGVMLIDLVIIFVVVIVLTTIISGVFVGIRAVQQGISIGRGNIGQDQLLRLLGPDGLFLTLLAQNIVCVGVPMLRIALIRRDPLAEIGFQAPRPLRLVLLGLGMAMLMYAGSVIISGAFAWFGIQQNQSEQFAKQFGLTPGATLGQALFLIGGGLIAPIGEEVLFRGYVFNAIRLTFQSRAWGLPLAYLGSALLFSLIHAPGISGAIALVTPIFFVALVLAWGMHRTGSLLPGIIAHSLFNSFQLVALIYCINNAGVCPNL